MKKITISKEQFELLTECAKSTIARSDERIMLRYVKIEVSNTLITSITLDGYRLAKLTIQHGQEGVEPFACYIQPFVIPKDLSAVEIEQKGDVAEVKLHCHGYDLSYSFTQPQGDFVDHEKIIPQTDPALSASFNARMLIDVLKPFCKLSDRHNLVKLSFVRNGDGINKLSPVLLSCSRENESIAAILLPIREV